MRPGQNRRMRSRTRKPPNPLTKTFESNGPDIKVRGTAQHIAEKYVQLSRDAHASGDPVAAENYLQHAEHYLRIILSAQAQYQQNFGALPRSFEDDQDDAGEEGGFDYGVHSYGAPQPDARFSAHEDEGQPAPQQRERNERHARNHDRYDRQERPERMDRPERQERMDRPERHDRIDRPERMDRPERQERMERPERTERPERVDRRDRFRRRREDMGGYNQPSNADDMVSNHPSGLPAFLTTPIRTISESEEQPARPLTHDLEIGRAESPRSVNPVSVSAQDMDDADKPLPRTRRRRTPVQDVAEETTVEATVEAAEPVRKLRATRTRRKSVDDVPVAE